MQNGRSHLFRIVLSLGAWTLLSGWSSQGSGEPRTKNTTTVESQESSVGEADFVDLRATAESNVKFGKQRIWIDLTATGEQAEKVLEFGHLQIDRAIAENGEQLESEQPPTALNNIFKGLVPKFSIRGKDRKPVDQPSDGFRIQFECLNKDSSKKDSEVVEELAGSVVLRLGDIEQIEAPIVARQRDAALRKVLESARLKIEVFPISTVNVQLFGATEQIAVVKVFNEDTVYATESRRSSSFAVSASNGFKDKWARNEYFYYCPSDHSAGLKALILLLEDVSDLETPFEFSDLEVPRKATTVGDESISGKPQTIEGPQGTKITAAIKWSKRGLRLKLLFNGGPATSALQFGMLDIESVVDESGKAVHLSMPFSDPRKPMRDKVGSTSVLEEKQPDEGFHVTFGNISAHAKGIARLAGHIRIRSQKASSEGILVDVAEDIPTQMIKHVKLANAGLTGAIQIQREVRVTGPSERLYGAELLKDKQVVCRVSRAVTGPETKRLSLLCNDREDTTLRINLVKKTEDRRIPFSFTKIKISKP